MKKNSTKARWLRGLNGSMYQDLPLSEAQGGIVMEDDMIMRDDTSEAVEGQSHQSQGMGGSVT